MQPLSKAAEAKLIGAIERAAAYVNDGMAPNDAIVKSASESNIPSGHINLMVHAYNTGRTTKQREQGNDALEKAADFPLADAQTVLDTLYPKAVKTSAEISRAHVVSPDYAVNPAGMLARRAAAQTKAAAAKISLPEKTWTPPPRDEEAAARRAASEKRAAELAQEELRRQATVAYSKAAAAMEELHEYFRHPGNMSFQDAVRETELRYGEDGVSVLNKLAAVYPHLTKQAATKDLIIGECQPCKLAAAVLSALEAYNEAQARVPAAKQAASKKAEPAVVTGSILYNPADEPLTLKSAAPAPAPMPRLGAIDSLMEAPAAIGRRMVGAVDFMDPRDPKDLTQGAYKDLTDPAHETELQNIRAQGVLHDLLLNDPVISGHDPHDVTLAFNDIAEVAPQSVSSPATMQALLRKRLEAGSMADFDIAQLVNMEKAKADTEKSRLDALKTEMGLV